jgi:hypothetical protein
LIPVLEVDRFERQPAFDGRGFVMRDVIALSSQPLSETRGLIPDSALDVGFSRQVYILRRSVDIDCHVVQSDGTS